MTATSSFTAFGRIIMSYFFFDSNGALWLTCKAGEPGAVALGPEGVARQVKAQQAGITALSGETHYAAAQRLGLVDCTQEWPVLVTP